jgi:hypothetical protein
MDVLRTPDERFANSTVHDFQMNYFCSEACLWRVMTCGSGAESL